MIYVVKDPFGNAEFIGASLPVDGYGFQGLSLSEDGSVLIGHLYGMYSGDINSPNWLEQLPHQVHSWDTAKLIQAALDNPLEKRLSEHFVMPDNVAQIVSEGAGNPAGTYFDQTPDLLEVEGRMGDVIDVDLKALLVASLGYGAEDLSDFELLPSDIQALADDFSDDNLNAQFKYVSLKTTGFDKHDPYSRDIAVPDHLGDGAFTNGTGEVRQFSERGALFLVPKLSEADLTILRSGGRLTDKFVDVNFSYKLKTGSGEHDFEVRQGRVSVIAKDVAQINTFFGDRPLDNPGYSEITLREDVSINSSDALDNYRVEQRLAYLGFPAIGTNSPGTNNTIQNLKVDGVFWRAEEAALKLFEKVVQYDNTIPDSRRFSSNSDGADGKLGKDEINSLNWINAFNAPHWMQFFESTANGFASSSSDLPGWINRQTGTRAGNIEVFGTSWMYDLMKAKQFASSSLVQSGSWMNGSVDANLGKTPTMHSTHDLGMAFDLGVSNYIYKNDAQKDDQETLSATINVLANVGWSVNSAVNYSGYLSNSIVPSNNNQRAALRDFLSLYAVTRDDATVDSSVNNGSRDDLPIINGDIVRAALFGDGTESGSIIAKVLIGGMQKDSNGNYISVAGQNPYHNIRTILDRLGIDNSPSKGHQNHFHLYLRPPEIVEINSTGNLKIGDVSKGGETITIPSLEEGGEFVFAIEMPYIAVQQTAAVETQTETVKANGSEQTPDYLVKDCTEVTMKDSPLEYPNEVSPSGMLKIALQSRLGYSYIDDATQLTMKVDVLEKPMHGALLVRYQSENGFKTFTYQSDPGYEGKDKASFIVKFEGKVYKIVLDIVVEYDIDERDPLCDYENLPELIKVYVPSSWLQEFDFANSVTFSDLEEGALGQTNQNRITLDNDANGYGWYIDLTPGLNEEFLPTANPYEWKAKPGGEAEGKIDLLTVLLHEAAHTLGHDHTTDAHALMAPTLEPGIRRLPSPELLADLQGHVDHDVEVTLNNPDDPSPLPNPIPFAGFGAFWMGRLRKSGYGYLLESVGVNNDRDIQYAVTPNPTLLNPEFAAVDGWNLSGDVSLGGNAAVMRESASEQTRLNQIFTLNDGDRFLRFTLDGIDLDDVSGAPDDAFEVALIDANTNQSLLGGNGLTHSDAAINLQADGSQYLAAEVSYTDNGDGSRTYLLDLSGITTGTAVSLSFDLIGFGRNEAATNSAISIRDLRLGIPETVDDVVTTAEDTAVTIDAQANDLDADQPGFAPVVVTGPAHGQLVINPDGSFDYTPDLDWSGEDSFTYLLSDGSADSNTSTVTITVTPVNDAPQASDAQLSTLEDQALTIDLVGYGTDVDSMSLSAQIVTGPANGVITQNPDGSFSFAANANFHGVDSFSYLISDGDLDSTTAVVTVDVTSVNDAPTGADNTVITLEDTAYTFKVADFGFSDVLDGNNFANVIIDQLPQFGSLTLSGVALTAGQTVSVTDIVAGNLVFAPVANANGSNYASFSFRVQDDDGTANGGVDTDPLARTMTIDVTSVNDAPSGADNTIITLEDTAYTLQVADFGFSDVNDGDNFANVIIDSVPAVGSLTVSGAEVAVGQTVSVADIVARESRGQNQGVRLVDTAQMRE